MAFARTLLLVATQLVIILPLSRDDTVSYAEIIIHIDLFFGGFKESPTLCYGSGYKTSNGCARDKAETWAGSKEEKEKESEKEPKMSMNAQFRAIQPGSSILSFVEKNLLGTRRTTDLRRAGYNIDLSAPLDNIPFSISSERQKIEENVFRNKLEYFAAAKVPSLFPPPSLPEIAFAGRSYVRKSSLLNALTRQWGVVRTSEKPGITQTINFFNLETKLCLVDLPG
ncbi:hypothetical protein VNO80_10775 [Phaseolus coccineus]|uniref:EngB-type G domain-containing protein n=1 Tax=Phaseolus coccineus TaxID=3886 RepID=A0AAN9N8T7_PHACN